MDILITCFLTGVSFACLDRDGQTAEATFPQRNVLGNSSTSHSTKRFSWKWFVAVRSECLGMHLFSIACKYPLLTVVLSLHSLKSFANPFSYSSHTKGQVLLLTKRSSFPIRSESPPIYLSHYTKRQRPWFWFSTNEIPPPPPRDQPILSQMQ